MHYGEIRSGLDYLRGLGFEVEAGRLLGGNLRCLLKLSDTEFWPDFTDSILFIESYRITEESCLRYFGKLKERGVFDKIRGCMVGF
ncbi:MAG: hypothetical protein HQL06_17150, partial [Nitrospirae bacterium]|nr:hypothetical protein [Nitrospirota bacterium]